MNIQGQNYNIKFNNVIQGPYILIFCRKRSNSSARPYLQAGMGRRISEMGMEEAIGEILTAKDQKPMLFEISPLEYDFHDIDGLYYMLDREAVPAVCC